MDGLPATRIVAHPRVMALAWLCALAAALLLAGRARAAEPAGIIAPPHGAQFMLYVSRPLGAGPHARNAWGLRYERTSPVSMEPGAHFSAPLRHRMLVDLQFCAHSAPRMLFGSRVTWDMGRRELGPTDDLQASWLRSAPPRRLASASPIDVP